MPLTKQKDAEGKVDGLVFYFVNDCLPTDEDYAKADALDGRVVFRNAKYTTIVESKDVVAVAGAIPEAYKDFPVAKPVKKEIKPPVVPAAVKPPAGAAVD